MVKWRPDKRFEGRSLKPLIIVADSVHGTAYILKQGHPARAGKRAEMTRLRPVAINIMLLDQ